MRESPRITDLLHACAAGDRASEERLFELVYEELQSMASRLLKREAEGQSLQTSALVHEAYLRLGGSRTLDAPNRAYFFGAAAHAMRRILIDRARRRQSAKRDHGQRAAFEDADAFFGAASEQSYDDLLIIDQALGRLSSLDERQARIVEMRFFGGLSLSETSEALGISSATVKRDWTMARAWLQGELQRGAS